MIHILLMDIIQITHIFKETWKPIPLTLIHIEKMSIDRMRIAIGGVSGLHLQAIHQRADCSAQTQGLTMMTHCRQ